MTKLLFSTGIVFFVIGVLLAVPALSSALGPVSIGEAIIESNPTQIKEFFAVSNLATLGVGFWIMGAIFFCSGAIISAIQSRAQ